MSKTNKHTVRLLRIAEEDLKDIAATIAMDKPKAAFKFVLSIEKSLLHLSSHPYLGRVPIEEELMGQGYRFWVVENYLVFYTVEGKTVLIHRILHGARNYIKLL